ncbi:MAG TPA: 5-oxoprolinase/urea amidolyase family protein [Acidimicrobiales bacterium]|nr:5-oxoprolinase/urea amidolyase family protein [Acidimicrobiales bacterium]
MTGRAVTAFGDTALLAAAGGPREARALATAVQAAGWAEEVVVGLRSVLVVFDPAAVPPDAAADALAGMAPADHRMAPPREVRVPVAFGGPDTDDACRLAGVGSDEMEALLTEAVLEVAVVGFSPGFPYLTGLPEPLRRIPRRDRPRPGVPAGAVALAGGFAGVYPQATPGGWHLVGRTAMALFDPAVPPYAVLRPGDRVRFEATAGAATAIAARAGAAPADATRAHAAPADATSALGRSLRPPLRPPPGTAEALVVEHPGLFSVVQDGGRRGLAHAGVPRAGPADPLAHGLANRLVGNPLDAAALEMTVAGPVLRCAVPGHLAVVGGDPDVSVDGHPVGSGHVVPVTAGQRVAVGPVRDGVRSYLGWAGGLAVPPVAGSRSTDLLSGLGPGPLVAGDRVGAGPPAGALRDHLAGWPPGDRTTLRVLPGPHPEWFPDDALAVLAADPLVVGDDSDRVGLRLAPSRPVPRLAGELDSQGMVTGAVQVPPDGHPVVLGPDHATLGGYPVVAVVIDADRWKLGQCRPGDRVRLLPVSVDEAAAARAATRRLLDTAVVGRYPVVAG